MAGVIAAAAQGTRLVAFVAIPGAGKSTLAGLLAKRLTNPALISSDAIRKELGDEADQALTPQPRLHPSGRSGRVQ
jgi:predicted kinase